MGQEYNFVSIDKVQKRQALNNVYTNKSHKFYIADITDAHTLNVIFEIERPDIVVHGAAETFVDKSIKEAPQFINSNVLGTQNVIDACVNWGTSKLVYISTDEVYGHLTSESAPSWTEESLINPRNPYAASKAAGELLIKAAHETFGLNYNITRSCNNYGPRQSPEKFIPKIIKNIINNTKMPVYGQGLQVRDWIYVEDNCDAIIKIILDGEDNQTYNISAGQEFSNIEVFQEICNAFNKGHDLIEFVEDRPGHDFRYSVDSSKLRNLGWKPEHKFKGHGVVKTAQWFVNNSWIFRQ